MRRSFFIFDWISEGRRAVVIVRNHVRQVREGLGMTQREAAERCGFKNPATLSRIERVETAPRSRTIAKIASAVGVEPRVLVP